MTFEVPVTAGLYGEVQVKNERKGRMESRLLRGCLPLVLMIFSYPMPGPASTPGWMKTASSMRRTGWKSAADYQERSRLWRRRPTGRFFRPRRPDGSGIPHPVQLGRRDYARGCALQRPYPGEDSAGYRGRRHRRPGGRMRLGAGDSRRRAS